MSLPFVAVKHSELKPMIPRERISVPHWRCQRGWLASQSGSGIVVLFWLSDKLATSMTGYYSHHDRIFEQGNNNCFAKRCYLAE